MTIQSNLPLSKPQFTEQHMSDFIAVLTGADEYLHAGDIAEAIGLEATDNGKRVVRCIAEALGGSVISGQYGYKLTENADVDEVKHFCHAQLSQAAKMTDRAKDAARIKRIKL